jgi:DHA2 family methylenomycin A resistance protein-like MFS transporter
MGARGKSLAGLGLVAACGVGIGMTAIDATAINVALADIQRDLGASVSSLQLTVNAFTLALVVVVVTVGRLGDMLGRRRVYLWGFAGYALASAICALAPGDIVLIVGRLLLGVAGAILFSLGLALVRAGMPEDRLQWGIGMLATGAGVGLALGPLVGGGLVDLISWRAIFWFNLPLIAIGVALTLAYVDESADPGAVREIDLPGVLVLGTGLGAVVLAVIQSSQWGWGSTATIALLIGGVALLALFVAIERAAKGPIVDFTMFRSPTFTGAGVICFVLFWVVFSFLFVFGLYFQTVEGDSALVAGLRLLPYAVAFVLAAPQAPAVVARLGPRTAVVTAMTVMVLGVVGLSEVDPGTPAWVALVLAAVIGVANAVVIVTASAQGVGAAPTAKAGLAAGVLVMMRYLGAVLGVALVGTVLDSSGDFVAGLSAGMKVTAAVGALGVLAAALTLDGRGGQSESAELRRRLRLHRAHWPHA